MLFWYTHFQKSSYRGRGTAPSPLGNFAPSLCPPPLTNPGYTTVTGVAIRGYKGPAPPHWLERLNKKYNVQKMSFWYANFQKSPYTVVPHHSPARSLRSLAMAPCWKILAMPVIILFMFALYISRYPSVRNTHFPWIIFSSYFFLLKIHPKCAPDRSISISKMQKLSRVGAPPPPARALRAGPSLAFPLENCR